MKLRTQVLLNLLTILSVLAIVLTHSSFAAITANPTLSNQTTTISYQGTLNDSLGQPISGATPMIFKLYNGPAGGTSLWTEIRSGNNAVAVNQGLFHVLLGSLSPLDVQLATQTLWLGISVNGDAEMTPRSQLASVPFAAVAGTVPNGSITQLQAPNLIEGPTANTKLAHGQAVATRINNQSSYGNVTISLEDYAFSQTPTVLCSTAGGGGFDWTCHVEYETPTSFTIWVARRFGGNDWVTAPVRWIAVGN
ncbi:hypothetical protein [Herpetosiphon gulosus]|uniref:Uncharacterized protein n=1 Tax=Herpetosiphon gulosus TaxID=1973496 RepID=A0ABP9X490_9CHLR